jgi:hypothetical protein
MENHDEISACAILLSYPEQIGNLHLGAESIDPGNLGTTERVIIFKMNKRTIIEIDQFSGFSKAAAPFNVLPQ